MLIRRIVLISGMFTAALLASSIGCGRDSDPKQETARGINRGNSSQGLGGNWDLDRAVGDEGSSDEGSSDEGSSDNTSPDNDSPAQSSGNNTSASGSSGSGRSPAGSASDAANREGVDSFGSAEPGSEGQIADDEDPVEKVPASARHPIDQIAEGKLYRAAIRALDEGEVPEAMRIREQLAGHATYHILNQAIDATALVKQGKYAEALDAAGEISKFPVLQGESYVIAAEAFRGQGNWNESIACLQNALRIDPYHVRAHQWLGAIYHDTGAMHLAVLHLRRVAALKPDDYRALRLSGLIHLEYEKFADAVSDYQRVLKRGPSPLVEREVRRELADALTELRQFDAALQVLDEADESPDVLASRAECLETSGRADQAMVAVKRGLQLAPQHHRLNLVHGRLLLAAEEAKSALIPLHRAVEAQPTDHEARFLLGRALLLTGQTAEGEAEIEASTQQKERFLEMAKLHLEAMNAPNDADIRLKLARLAEESGRWKIAIMWNQAVVGMIPDHAEATAALERLEEKLANSVSNAGRR